MNLSRVTFSKEYEIEIWYGALSETNIESCAFADIDKLKNLVLEHPSRIRIIESESFMKSGIGKLMIPPNAFAPNFRFSKVVFMKRSQIRECSANAFGSIFLTEITMK